MYKSFIVSCEQSACLSTFDGSYYRSDEDAIHEPGSGPGLGSYEVPGKVLMGSRKVIIWNDINGWTSKV